MPKLTRNIEGRGNGIKTLIPNMSDIAKALSRPPSYPTKYFGCELGAQVGTRDRAKRGRGASGPKSERASGETGDETAFTGSWISNDGILFR